MPFTVQQIHDLFLSRLVIDYDYVFCMTITKTRSPIFDNAQQASFAILNDYRPVRAAAGHDTPFALRVVDTQNLFAAQGITAVEAVRLRDAGEGAPKIRARLENLALHTHGYMVPPDLYYMRNRARTKGDRSVELAQRRARQRARHQAGAALQSRRDRAGGQDQGLRHRPCRSCSSTRSQRVEPRRTDDADAVPELRRRTRRRCARCPATTRLRQACQGNNIELFESVMSLTGMVNVGKGALVVGFAAEGQKFSA